MDNAVGIIVVPDLAPADLVFRASCEIDATHLSDEIAVWDFYRYRVEEGQPVRLIDVRGKRYEVLTWMPGEYKTTEQVREHFRTLDADGNTGAFLAWAMETKPQGYHISIPSDDALLWRDPESGYLSALSFNHDDDGRRLRLISVQLEWGGGRVFVAFREISAK